MISEVFKREKSSDWMFMSSERKKISIYFILQEEYEDSSGNVVNKKTYEDLKRQGLL